MASRIEDYAFLGDTHTAALVGLDGSVDWLCLPRFDSPACFAALLGDRRNGHWQLTPCDPVRDVRRRYRANTMVLETELTTDSGVVRLVDTMPPRDNRADLVRRVEGVSGTVAMRQDLVIRFGYGKVRPWIRRSRDRDGRLCLLAVAGPDALCLRSSVVDLPHPVDGRHAGEFTVTEGDVRDFQLTWFSSHEEMPAELDVGTALDYSERFWAWWASMCSYDGLCRDEVLRSLLTLKALTFDPSGGIVAAATTSLPEHFGGTRNWDYRFCWLRDAALTLSALLACGFQEEAQAWRDWLLRALAGDPADIQVMYGVAGERELPEMELTWLSGYENSRPVRVGNAATEQYQADIIGQVLDALDRARRAGVQENGFSWPLQRALIGHLEDSWQQPDHSMWEIRGEPRHFTHSRVLVWVAFDRAVRAVEEFGLPGPVQRWRDLRDQIRAEILDRGWNEELNSFTQYYGGNTVDAALLTLPALGFLPADDKRMTGTVALVEGHLVRQGLVYRYDTGAPDQVDGLPPGEYSFLPCSFWLIDYYARAGRTDEALALLGRLLAVANDVGLFAEEYDPDSERMAGNVPQALTHLALVHAVLALAEREGAAEGMKPRAR